MESEDWESPSDAGKSRFKGLAERRRESRGEHRLATGDGSDVWRWTRRRWRL